MNLTWNKKTAVIAALALITAALSGFAIYTAFFAPEEGADVSVADPNSFCGDGITQGPNGDGQYEACDGESYCNDTCDISTNRTDGVCRIGLVTHHEDVIATQSGFGASITSLNEVTQPLRDVGGQTEVRFIHPGGDFDSGNNASYADLDLLVAVDSNLSNVPFGADTDNPANFRSTNQRVRLDTLPATVSAISQNVNTGLHLIVTGDHGIGGEGTYTGDIANIFSSAVTNELDVSIDYLQSDSFNLYVDRQNDFIGPDTFLDSPLAMFNDLPVFLQVSDTEVNTLIDGTWSPGILATSGAAQCVYATQYYGGGAPYSPSNLTSPTNSGANISLGGAHCMVAYEPPTASRGLVLVDAGSGASVRGGALERIFSGMEDCTPGDVPNICGDGQLNEETEVCDDGNTVDGDGCSADCKVIDVPPFDGECKVGYTTNDAGLPIQGYTVFKPFQDVANRAGGISEGFSDTGINTSNLIGTDILVVTTSTPLEPGPANTRLFTDAEIAVIQDAFNKGMNIIISTGGGVIDGEFDGSKIGRDLLNRISGIGIDITTEMTTVSETTQRVVGFDSLTNDRPIDTRNLSGFTYNSPSNIVVDGTNNAVCQAEVDGVCVFAYQPSDGTKGWVVVDGNGGIPIDGYYPEGADFFGSKESNYDVGRIQMFFEYTPECQIDGPPGLCEDGIDNDGDGTIDEGDECGEGTFCGDGTVQAPNDDGVNEVCDRGAENGVECSPGYEGSCTFCSVTCSEEVLVTGPFCGDGIKQENEACDDGAENADTGAICNTDCEFNPECRDGEDNDGDGKVDCEDGNEDPGCYPDGRGGTVDGSSCNNDDDDEEDTPATCGDGIQDPGEECDDGNLINTDSCTNSCTNAACGDGYKAATEECDDGNTVDGDGCSSSCDLTTECNDGIDNDGDGKIDCEAGNEDPGCFPDGKGGGGSCNENDDDETDAPASCGDGILDPGEACDNGADNDNTNAICNESCQYNAQCNDGLDNDGDGRVDCGFGTAADPGCYPDGNGGGGSCSPNDNDERDNIPVTSRGGVAPLPNTGIGDNLPLLLAAGALLILTAFVSYIMIKPRLGKIELSKPGDYESSFERDVAYDAYKRAKDEERS